MNKDSNSTPKEQDEDRGLRGTWPWFALNILLFPAPAHMTMLRIKKFSLARSLLHLGVTVSLFFLLIGSGVLQVLVPTGGKLWMLLPMISGLLVLVAHRSMISTFRPFAPIGATRQYWRPLLVLLGLLVVIHILPGLDLIGGHETDTNPFQSQFVSLPLWQETIILLLGTLLLLLGYVTNSFPSFSVNRVIILYACFLVILTQLYWILELAFRWLSVTGGFASLLTLILLATILALDYYDAVSFGQFTRRYFLLTWTKTLSFVILWLCFFGLPQKAASLYVSYAYNQVKSQPIAIPSHHLIFSDQDRFKSGHEAHRRIRFLQTQSLLTAQEARRDQLSILVAEAEGSILAANSDICRLQQLLNTWQIPPTLQTERIPIFRPVHKEWDVMLSALVLQGDLSISDLDQTIAGFKSSLPKASQGQLPDLDTPYDTNYVALATGMKVDFVPPHFKLIKMLLDKQLIPVLSLRLAGKDYWSALIHIDNHNKVAWFRLENASKRNKSIRLLFDINESADRKTEILSSQIIALPLDYFTEMVAHNSMPVIVFSKKGLSNIMPEQFPSDSQEKIRKAIADFRRPSVIQQKIMADNKPELHNTYLRYLHGIALLYKLVRPVELDTNRFLQSNPLPSLPAGRERLKGFAEVLAHIGPLKDTDRMDLAYRLVRNDHSLADPDLFFQLANAPPASSDLVDCRDAFTIGRQLFLLNHHSEALSYLKIAFLRHPFNAEYEIWYQIAMVKMKKTPPPRYAHPEREPDLQLYYQVIVDIENGKSAAALQRLEDALAKDNLNSLLNHLLHKYFQRPLDDNYFFPGQEGL